MRELGNCDDTNWIQTYTGRAIFPARPTADDICIEDIANALARQCRYGGHCLSFYSVAEHCVHVSDAASPENKLTALMHDASEAYLLDIPRPIKPLLNGYYEIEARLMEVIAKKYDFRWPMPDEVKLIDAAIITDERQQNMAEMAVDNVQWGSLHKPIGVTLKFWDPKMATAQFIA